MKTNLLTYHEGKLVFFLEIVYKIKYCRQDIYTIHLLLIKYIKSKFSLPDYIHSNKFSVSTYLIEIFKKIILVSYIIFLFKLQTFIHDSFEEFTHIMVLA